MISALLVFITQLTFVFLKVKAVKNVVKGGKLQQAAYSIGLQGFWLVSTYLGIAAVGNFDILTIICYLAGGGLGGYLSATKK